MKQLLIRFKLTCLSENHRIRVFCTLMQAFLFYLPSVFWRLSSERSGINVHNLVEAADTIQNALYPERRDKTIR